MKKKYQKCEEAKVETRELYLKELNEQGRTLFSCDKYDEAAKNMRKQWKKIPCIFHPISMLVKHTCEAYIMSDWYDKVKKMMNKMFLIDKNNGEAYFQVKLMRI